MNAKRMEQARMWAARFRYVADRGDRWTVPRSEPPKGDCEDLALGVAYVLAGRSMRRMLWMFLTQRVELFTGDSLFNGERHAALRYKGQWIDTGERSWSSRPRLDGARRVRFVRILRELGYGPLRFVAVALIVIGLIGLVSTVQAETLNLRGTTITLREGWEAPYEVHFSNAGNNYREHNGVYDLHLRGISVSLDYQMAGPWGGEDRIVVTAPEGWVCDPADCTLYLPEGFEGAVLLHRAGVGW